MRRFRHRLFKEGEGAFVLHGFAGVYEIERAADLNADPIVLESGTTLRRAEVHGLAPGTAAPSPYPGQPVWAAVRKLFISPELWAKPFLQARRLGPEQIADVTEQLFSQAHQHGAVIGGRESPGLAAQEFTAFAPDDHLHWHLDWVMDTAVHASGRDHVQYTSVRVFTAAEWQTVNSSAKPAADTSPLSSPGASKPTRGGGPKPKGEDAFIAEMVRFALTDPCETKHHMALHMQEWSAGLPDEDQVSQSTIERRIARWWPAGID